MVYHTENFATRTNIGSTGTVKPKQIEKKVFGKKI